MHDEAVEAHERQIVRAVHSVFLKWFVIAFFLGTAIVVAGEMLARVASTRYVMQFASWCIRAGLGISSASFALGVISWFTRETTKHAGFRDQRLPSGYRLVAWSFVALVVVAFEAFVS